ncbi:hypothetical protein CTA1_2946 [Colletotrichum tanaceti]|uniref:Uncharacterized protein n=1 Tax=Colletotrichum tanaceti TaxID=1306861 RepID=A0A4U6X9Z9_9PEZI|nr:hypothetical protein CTA1_2946 [Colletotrichum tanaceti]
MIQPSQPSHRQLHFSTFFSSAAITMSEFYDISPALEFARYDPGEKLTLYPYKPVEPYGLPQYSKPKSFYYEVKGLGRIRNFDPAKAHETPPKQQARIGIVKSLSGGIKSGAQVLLCKVTKAPDECKHLHAPFPGNPRKRPSQQAPSLLVAKVFDSMFFPGTDEFLTTLYGNEAYAEQTLSREAGALSYLYQRGLPADPSAKGKNRQKNDNSVTGHPHLVPQYYGSWAVRFDMGEDDKGDTRYRCAALVLMEYVEGHAMEDLCTRDKRSGFLRPNPTPITFHRYQDASGISQKRTLKLTEGVRLKIFRDFIHEIVCHMHIGVQHPGCKPRSLLVTLRNHGAREGVRELDEPRMVMLDYNLTEVWRKTRQGRKEGQSQHCLETLPLPPHPLERCSPEGFGNFIGWFNAKWTLGEFQDWLRKEFGELEEGSEEGSKGKYSTFKTLDKIEEAELALELAEEERKEKEKDERLEATVAMFQNAEKQKKEADLHLERLRKFGHLPHPETNRYEVRAGFPHVHEVAIRQRPEHKELGGRHGYEGQSRHRTLLAANEAENSGRVARGSEGDDDAAAAK